MALDSISELFQTLGTAFLFAVPIVLALVQGIKQVFNLEGNANLLVSFLVGVFLSGLFGVAFLFPGVADYIALVFFVLSVGLVASGFYSFGTRIRDGE